MKTWKEFKEQVEAAGVKDDDKIEWIDISGYSSDVDIHRDKDDNSIAISSF